MRCLPVAASLVFIVVSIEPVPVYSPPVALSLGAIQQPRAPTPGCRTMPADRTPLIVFSLRGAITTIRADGRQLCRLTPYVVLHPHATLSGYTFAPGAATDPHLSTDGRQIAYLTTTTTDAHAVWVVPAIGSAGRPRRITSSSRTIDREAPSWSPDGRYLAYYDGNPFRRGSPRSYIGLSVEIRRIDERAAPLVSRVRFALKGSPNNFAFGKGPPIAWSPDSSAIASIIGFVQGKTWPIGLNVGVADTGTGRAHTIAIRFPGGLLGKDQGRGSYPSGGFLAWTPDSRRLEVGTFGRGAGGTLTGIWRVPASGGLAHLIVGTHRDVREHMPASMPLNGATGFLVSPNHLLLATDPIIFSWNGFWVADQDGHHGVLLSTNVAKGCVLAQYTWLSDSSGLAYVTECSVPATNRLRLSLYSVRRGTRPHLLLQIVTSQPDALDLAPTHRCLGCG